MLYGTILNIIRLNLLDINHFGEDEIFTNITNIVRI